MLRKAGGRDKLVRCTEDMDSGKLLRLGVCVCDELSNWRSFFTSPCASISRFAGIAMTSPSVLLSSLLSLAESLEERKSGLWSAGSAGRVIPAELALTIESMSHKQVLTLQSRLLFHLDMNTFSAMTTTAATGCPLGRPMH